MLRDIKNSRSRKQILSAWVNVFLSAPTIKMKLVFLLNFPFIFVPLKFIRLIYPFLTGKPFVSNNFEEIRKSRE